jgi:hypothetical protein
MHDRRVSCEVCGFVNTCIFGTSIRNWTRVTVDLCCSFAGRPSWKLVLTHTLCSAKHNLVWQDEVVTIPTWTEVIRYVDTSGTLLALRQV